MLKRPLFGRLETYLIYCYEEEKERKYHRAIKYIFQTKMKSKLLNYRNWLIMIGIKIRVRLIKNTKIPLSDLTFLSLVIESLPSSLVAKFAFSSSSGWKFGFNWGGEHSSVLLSSL